MANQNYRSNKFPINKHWDSTIANRLWDFKKALYSKLFFMDMFFLSGRAAKMKLLKKQKNCDYLRNISYFRLKLIEYTGFIPLVSMAHQKFRILEQIGRKESFSFFSSKIVYMRGNQILWVVM